MHPQLIIFICSSCQINSDVTCCSADKLNPTQQRRDADDVLLGFGISEILLTLSSSKLMSPSSSSVSSSSGASLIRAFNSVLAGRTFRKLKMRCNGDCPPPGGRTSCCSRLSLCFLAKLTNTWTGRRQRLIQLSSLKCGTQSEGTHVVQGGLTDGVVLNAQDLHHLLHLTEHLGQGDALRLELVLDLGVVTLLGRW